MLLHDAVLHIVIPSSTVGVTSSAAKFNPDMVTEVPAVVAALKAATLEATGASKENTVACVPTRVAIVTPRDSARP